MLTPAIPLYITHLGATESQVGVILTSFFISSIAARMLVNVLLGKIGKKRLLIAGVALNTIVMLLYGLSDSLWSFATLRAIQGLGFGTTTTLTATMVADLLPDTRRGEGVGYFTMGTVMAVAIAPPVSLHIIGVIGFRAAFFAASGISLLATIIASMTEEPLVASVARAESTVKSFFQWRNLFHRNLILPAALLIFFGISRSTDSNYIAIFAEARNLDQLSWYYVIQTATMFCTRFFVGRLSDRKGRNYVIIPGGIAMLALNLTLSFTNTNALMLLSAVFCGLGIGILAPALQLWMFSRVEPEKRNIASAAYFNFQDIGISIGAFSLGFIAEHAGYPSMFMTAACAALLFIIGYITVGREKKTAQQ